MNLKLSNLLFAIATGLWGAVAYAQATADLDFGQRFTALSLDTWVWSFVVLFAAFVWRLGLDVVAKRAVWSFTYFFATASTCFGAGFVALGFSEWWLSKYVQVPPMAQAAFIAILCINNDVVVSRVRRIVGLGFDAIEARMKKWGLIP